MLSGVFHFHPLAVEDAIAQVHHPKIPSYDGYLYLILHGIDYKKSETAFATHDIDFFLGAHVSGDRPRRCRRAARRPSGTSVRAASRSSAKGRRR